jgi:hypothetical protein
MSLPRPSRRLLAIACALVATGCAAADPEVQSSRPTATASPSASSGSPAGEQTGSPTRPTPQDAMDIRITIGDARFDAVLDESAASRDLLEQLPLTLDLDDFASAEKAGALPSPLSTAGQPAGADPDIGDIGYFAPWNDLVLYYGEQSYHDGIVILGRLEGAERLARMQGAVTVTIEALER